jgi:16S rRNA (cytosine1402-N4)-methyltransferase
LDDRHLPVLVAETLAALQPDRGGLYVDATVGLGGHAEAILAAAPAARLLGIDRDPDALALAGRRLAGFGDRVRFAQGNFDQLPELLGGLAEPWAARPAGILADLGVSSLQLDRPERGFSFRFDGPLDMRMGGSGRTAADIVNQSSEAELTDILKEYGEEWQARRIARTLVLARREKPLETTADLRAVIDRAKGGRREREGRVDPATRVFQALRIAVNDELAGLERFLDQAVQLLDGDGRLVIISYHSLEDRIVKNRLRDLSRGEADPVTGRPRAESRLLELLTKKPVRPSEAEVAWNPRSRSARLRAARRV